MVVIVASMSAGVGVVGDENGGGADVFGRGGTGGGVSEDASDTEETGSAERS